MMLVPHIVAGAPDASCMMRTSALQSFWRSSSTPLMKAATLCLVGLVFASAMSALRLSERTRKSANRNHTSSIHYARHEKEPHDDDMEVDEAGRIRSRVRARKPGGDGGRTDGPLRSRQARVRGVRRRREDSLRDARRGSAGRDDPRLPRLLVFVAPSDGGAVRQ